MRLIDADALMKEYAEFVKESNNSDFADVPTWNDAVSLLGSAPTVKAIPIEFIEEQIDITTDITNRDEFDVLYAGNLMYLLKLWEIENEID